MNVIISGSTFSSKVEDHVHCSDLVAKQLLLTCLHQTARCFTSLTTITKCLHKTVRYFTSLTIITFILQLCVSILLHSVLQPMRHMYYYIDRC